MECTWDRLSFSLRRIWVCVGEHLRFRRKTGLRELRNEVSACEYEDVQVMWELLRKSQRQVIYGHRGTQLPPARKRSTPATTMRTRRMRKPWDGFNWVSCGSHYRFRCCLG